MIPPGSKIYVAGSGLLSDGIRHAMDTLAVQQGYEPVPWTHTAYVVRIKGELKVMSAEASGAELFDVDWYLRNRPNHFIKIPIVPLTEKKIADLEAFAVEMCITHKRKYQFGNFLAFLHWLSWFRIGISWKIVREGDKRVFCFELTGRAENIVGLWMGKDLDFATIFDHWLNPKYTAQQL